MNVCRSERVRPRLAVLALTGLLLGQTLVPCGILLSSVHAAELRVKNQTPNAQSLKIVIPDWVTDVGKRPFAAPREQKLRLAQLQRPSKSEETGNAEDLECLDCEVDLKPLDLSEVPTEKALRRAGGVDGALFPMRRGDAQELGVKLDFLLKRWNIEGGLRGELPPKDPRFAALKRSKERYERARAINLLFGRAVKAWHGGERARAVELFGQYMEKYPRSPWAGEAALHLGYAAKNDGRLLDAEAIFQEVSEKSSDKPNKKLRQAKRERRARGGGVADAEREADVDAALEGAGSFEEAVEKLDSAKASDDDDESFEIHLKAKQQLADIEMAMGHYNDASDKLAEIKEEDTDWHRRVWARAQLQRANFLQNTEENAGLIACGPQALGMMMAGLNKSASAEKVEMAVAKNASGFSMAELQALAKKNGVKTRGFRADVAQLPKLSLPAILHYDFGRDSGAQGRASGHFVTLQGVDSRGKAVRVFDPLNKKSVRLSYAQLRRQWSGQGLALSTKDASPVGISLSNSAMKAAIGSSTTFSSTPDLGDVTNNSSVGIGDGISAPAVSVNQASLNLYINHTVTSYQPMNGPSPAFTLSYNSESSGEFDYFGVVSTGRKWTSNFSSISYLNYQDVDVNTTGSQIVIEMPDGSQDLYHWDQSANRYNGEKGNFKWIGRVSSGYDSNGYIFFNYSLNFPDGTGWNYIGDYYSSVLSEMIDSHQQSIRIYYYPWGGNGKAINKIIDAEGRETKFDYMIAGSLGSASTQVIKSITDPFGRQTTFSYDDNNGNLLSVTDSQGRVFRYTYDTQFSDIKTIELPPINDIAPVWSFNRDNERDNFNAGRVWQGSRFTITDPNNGIQERYYEATTGRTYYVAPQNYVPAPNTYSGGRATRYHFTLDPNGARVPDIVVLPDSTSLSYAYEAQHGFVSRITDRQGAATSYTYNAMGQVLTVKDPNRNVTTTTYAPNGLDPISVTRPNPNVSDPNAPDATTQVMSATYNYAHQPETITDVGGTTTLTYTYWGALERTIDPQGRATRNIYYDPSIYDNQSQLIRVEQSDKPVGNAARNWVVMARFTYDSLFRIKDVFDEEGLKTSFQYNSRDKVTVTTFSDKSTAQNIYRTGNDDVLVGVRDRAGRTSWMGYDDLGRTTIVQDASNQFSYLSYDKNGNLKQLRDNNSNITQWNYDALDRAISKRFHDGTTDTYVYGLGNNTVANNRGNLIQTTGTRGQIVNYEYDDNGNQTKVDYPNMPDVTMSYNRLDDVAQITDAIGTHTLDYDNYGRLVSNDGPLAGDTQTYTYDALQRIETQTLERGASGGVQSQTFAYDALGRLASLNANGTQGTGLTTYSYDGNTDRLSFLNHPNRTKSELRYDEIGRLQKVFNGANNDAYYNRYSSVYDARDVKTSTQSRIGGSDPLVTTAYSYDALDQLKQESVAGGVAGVPYTTNYNYDAMGNRTQSDTTSSLADGTSRFTKTTGAANALNQLPRLNTTRPNGSVYSTDLSYDTAGNLTQVLNYTGSRTVYVYDDADRLTRIDQRNASNVVVARSAFVYDYASRRAISREYVLQNGVLAQTEEKRRVFDGLDVVQERNANNQVTAQLVRDGNIGGILSRTTATGATFYGYDGNGNVTLLTDNAGQDVGHYRYDAFGNTLEAVGARAGENPYRFSTKELHAASGLYDYGLRFYSPGMGRWMNRDPLGESGEVNLYVAMGNSPINAVDAYGLYVKVEIYPEDPYKVILTVPIAYKGDATEELIQTWNESIENAWSGTFGKYEVTTHVVVEKVALNEVTVVDKFGRSNVVGGWKGTWYTTYYRNEDDNRHTPAHEAGHLMGLPDRYEDVKGKGSVTIPGWENNIMGSRGGVVEERDIKQILKDHAWKPK